MMATATEYGLMAALIAVSGIAAADKLIGPEGAFDIGVPSWAISTIAIGGIILLLSIPSFISAVRRNISKMRRTARSNPSRPATANQAGAIQPKGARSIPSYDLEAALNRYDARPMRLWPANTTGAEKFNQNMQASRDTIKDLRAQLKALEDTQTDLETALGKLDVMPHAAEAPSSVKTHDGMTEDAPREAIEGRQDSLKASLSDISDQQAYKRKKLRAELEYLDVEEQALTRRIEIESGQGV